MSDTGLYRVLADPHGDGWLFVSVGADPPSPNSPGHDDGRERETDPDVDGVTPRVPGGGSDPGPDPEPDGSEDPPGDATGETDASDYDPVQVPATGHGSLTETVEGLRPGYLVRASLSWETSDPRVTELSVRKRTLFAFADDVVNLFEAAQGAWRSAVATGDAMASQVTRDTDGRPNGVLYVFADDEDGDRLAEFRSGRRPLEPLLARVNDAAPLDDDGDAWTSTDDAGGEVSLGPGGVRVAADAGAPPEHGLGRDREVFVLRPADGPFVVVLVALRKGSTLADTVRETYHCPRPDEPS